MSLETLPVHSASVKHVWELVAPVLQKAVDRFDGYDMIDVRERCMTAQWQLWTACDDRIRGVMVTCITVYPQKKTCEIIFFAGDGLDEMLPLLSDIEGWAMQNGCSDIELRGRSGWSRVLDGYDTDTICRKRLGV